MTMPSGQQITETGTGIIVGADPKPPVPAGPPPESGYVQPQPAQQQAPQNGNQPRYTDEDLERVRREEKDKLYGRIETLDQEVKRLADERKVEADRLKAEADQRAAELKAKEEEQMDLRQLLERKDQDWQHRFDEMNSSYEADRALFAKERRLQELEAYRIGRIEQEAEYIMPELRDLVHGDDEAEIDSWIEAMKQRTASIFDQIAAAQGQNRQQMRGAATTAPPMGPMEQLSTQESFTAEQISAMNIDEYKKHRDGLLRSASQSRRLGG